MRVKNIGFLFYSQATPTTTTTHAACHGTSTPASITNHTCCIIICCFHTCWIIICCINTCCIVICCFHTCCIVIFNTCCCHASRATCIDKDSPYIQPFACCY
ncbi:putative keratin-associated protein 4-16 [Eriocheir sinensis]|uniref:putative keratin-associated protein 4-16 n=1 Tax=Eriocheir sinensis TaxID=95602 RepID=UPI0021C71955|nr:putative keratin-associated protein 4-16 [Eriocheir sinensis]